MQDLSEQFRLSFCKSLFIIGYPFHANLSDQLWLSFRKSRFVIGNPFQTKYEWIT